MKKLLLMLCVGVSLVTNAWAQEGTVVRVVDGDTIKLKVDGTIGNYRLAAIDTPETYNNIKAKRDIIKCGIPKEEMFLLGGLAKVHVYEKYPKGSTINFLTVDIGRYGRPIIWIPGLLADLVKEGHARVLDYSNIDKSEILHLTKLQNDAIANKLGIWRKLTCWE